MKTLWVLWVVYTLNGTPQAAEPVGHILPTDTAEECVEMASYADSEVTDKYRPVEFFCVQTEVIDA